MPAVAASSAACWSSRPSQRAAASAARSVQRAKDSQTHGSLPLDVLVFDLMLDGLGHTRSNSAARASTSSITALIVSSTFVFSITGTSVSRARSTMNS